MWQQALVSVVHRANTSKRAAAIAALRAVAEDVRSKRLPLQLASAYARLQSLHRDMERFDNTVRLACDLSQRCLHLTPCQDNHTNFELSSQLPPHFQSVVTRNTGQSSAHFHKHLRDRTQELEQLVQTTQRFLEFLSMPSVRTNLFLLPSCSHDYSDTRTSTARVRSRSSMHTVFGGLGCNCRDCGVPSACGPTCSDITRQVNCPLYHRCHPKRCSSLFLGTPS